MFQTFDISVITALFAHFPSRPLHIMGLSWNTCFMLLLLGFSNGETAEKDVCLDGWIQATWVDLGCLLMNTTSELVAWTDANAACQAVENGRLVEIQTEEQFEFLKMELDAIDGKVHDWWTGGNGLGREGNWMWMGSLTPVPHFLFNVGDPNGGNVENCLLLENGWNYDARDYTCKATTLPLCQQVIKDQ